MRKALLLAIVLGCNILTLCAQGKLTPEAAMLKVATGKKFTLVILKAGQQPIKKDDKKWQQLQMDHLVRLFQLEKDGKIAIFGPVMNNRTMQGIIVFNSTDKDAIRKELNKDPYVTGGYLKYDMFDWFSIPGQRIPG